MNHKIEFHGLSPFDLPASQRSEAYRGSDAVTLEFWIADPDSSDQITVRIAVLNNQALRLADAIKKAATDNSEAS